MTEEEKVNVERVVGLAMGSTRAQALAWKLTQKAMESDVTNCEKIAALVIATATVISVAPDQPASRELLTRALQWGRRIAEMGWEAQREIVERIRRRGGI